ncbi:MAG: Chromosomal replication initiator protein DnaA, partial [uncultured Solirubrobacteraceae bacterium]
ARSRPPSRLASHPQRAPAGRRRRHLAPVARAAQGRRARGRDADRRGARRHPGLGGAAVRAAPADLRGHRPRARGRGPARRAVPARPDARRNRRACGRRSAHARAARRGAAPQPSPDLRPVRHRRLEPPRPRGGARRRRAARTGLQPALHLRPSRPREDAPPALDRQLRRGLRRRAHLPLHHRRGVHQRLHRRAAHRRDRRLQGGAPRRGRAPGRRRPVPREQGQDRGGVLPHVQRAARRRLAARTDLRPAPARHERARGPSAGALRGRPRVRRATARLRHPPHHPAQARAAGRHPRRRARRPRRHRRARSPQHPRARGRAHPGRRLRLADRATRRRRSRRRGPRRALSRPAPARPHRRGHPAPDLRGVRRLPRGHALPAPRRPSRVGPPGGHVPHARADRPDAPRHRPRLREPQPHDRPARLPAHRRAHGCRPRGVRPRRLPHPRAPGGRRRPPRL